MALLYGSRFCSAISSGVGGAAEMAGVPIASMTSSFHLLSADTTFARVLVDASQRRLGSVVGGTSIATFHKHVVQLVWALRANEGRPGPPRDTAILMYTDHSI